jgi:hypothetical protein
MCSCGVGASQRATLPHLLQDWAHPCPYLSARGMGSPLSHPHRDRPGSALPHPPGLLRAPRPRLHWDWCRSFRARESARISATEFAARAVRTRTSRDCGRGALAVPVPMGHSGSVLIAIRCRRYWANCRRHAAAVYTWERQELESKLRPAHPSSTLMAYRCPAPYSAVALPLHSLWDSDARSRHGLAAAAAAGSACRRYQAHRRRHAAQARSPPASARRELIVSPQESVLGIRCAVVPSRSLRVCVRVRRVLYLVIIDSAGWSCAQLPHLPQDWAHPTPTSAPGLDAPLATSSPGLGPPLSHLHQD